MLQPMNNLFELIMLESSSVADQSLLLKYTTAFLTHLMRFEKSDLNKLAFEDVRMLKLFQLLEDNFKENRSAEFYAGHIGLTPKRANEILRHRMNTTINGLINRLLVLEAKRELMHHHHSVKEVAYNLGFSDQSYFARFFRKHAGLTPEEFKAKDA